MSKPKLCATCGKVELPSPARRVCDACKEENKAKRQKEYNTKRDLEVIDEVALDNDIRIGIKHRMLKDIRNGSLPVGDVTKVFSKYVSPVSKDELAALMQGLLDIVMPHVGEDERERVLEEVARYLEDKRIG